MFHTNADLVNGMLTWLSNAITLSQPAAEAQRYCLVTGILIRDLTILKELGHNYATNVPRYLVRSTLDSTALDSVIAHCRAAFMPPKPRRVIVSQPVASSSDLRLEDVPPLGT